MDIPEEVLFNDEDDEDAFVPFVSNEGMPVGTRLVKSGPYSTVVSISLFQLMSNGFIFTFIFGFTWMDQRLKTQLVSLPM